MAGATKQDSAAHVLPAWFEWFQDNIVLTLLVIAGMILNGLMFTEGIVPSGNFFDWGILPTVKVAAFFLAGSGLTGVALRAGAAMASAFHEDRIVEGLVMLLISAGFIPLEIWASITIRSLEHVFTPADTWALQMIGHPDIPVSPTVFVIAVAGPFILFVWGIVTRKKAPETPEEMKARQERELLKIQHNAAKNKARAEGWAATGRAAIRSAKGEQDEDSAEDNQGDISPDNGGNITQFPAGKSSKKAGNAALRGMITWLELQAYVKDELGVPISEDMAKSLCRSHKNGGPVDGTRGGIIGAPKAAMIRAARAKWGANSRPIDVAD